ncbi:helix-turn-helix domain-containing protein [Streptomyces griseorubiginosus]|uniref:helix-turn-helix domain-containing protein n=1 Tax=Streptomyces griseorubiginosus TaxID=67304 RepID=UPI00114037C6|nr:helix-turn-helix transcriptional regulator [Streptomyces griseorubiginosus]
MAATSGEGGNALGAFLRARRELVRPEDVGIPARGLRRVPGLRREEVALLAGVSAQYYLRLEQGRDRHPSVQVLEALAGVLQLDTESTAYLMELARPRVRRRATRRTERVPTGTLMLLDTLNVPAFVVNRYRDVLAANPLAVALSPLMAPGTNRLIALFTDPQAAEYHPDWEQNTAGVVAQLRAEVGTDTDDERFQALVGELSLKSERFRRLWARHEVRRAGSDAGVIRHPQVGELCLRREKYAVVGTDGLLMVLHHAEPGTVSAQRLEMLASWAASEHRPREAAERPRGHKDATQR